MDDYSWLDADDNDDVANGFLAMTGRDASQAAQFTSSARSFANRIPFPNARETFDSARSDDIVISSGLPTAHNFERHHTFQNSNNLILNEQRGHAFVRDAVTTGKSTAFEKLSSSMKRNNGSFMQTVAQFMPDRTSESYDAVEDAILLKQNLGVSAYSPFSSSSPELFREVFKPPGNYQTSTQSTTAPMETSSLATSRSITTASKLFASNSNFPNLTAHETSHFASVGGDSAHGGTLTAAPVSTNVSTGFGQQTTTFASKVIAAQSNGRRISFDAAPVIESASSISANTSMHSWQIDASSHKAGRNDLHKQETVRTLAPSKHTSGPFHNSVPKKSPSHKKHAIPTIYAQPKVVTQPPASNSKPSSVVVAFAGHMTSKKDYVVNEGGEAIISVTVASPKEESALVTKVDHKKESSLPAVNDDTVELSTLSLSASDKLDNKHSMALSKIEKFKSKVSVEAKVSNAMEQPTASSHSPSQADSTSTDILTQKDAKTSSFLCQPDIALGKESNAVSKDTITENSVHAGSSASVSKAAKKKKKKKTSSSADSILSTGGNLIGCKDNATVPTKPATFDSASLAAVASAAIAAQSAAPSPNPHCKANDEQQASVLDSLSRSSPVTDASLPALDQVISRDTAPVSRHLEINTSGSKQVAQKATVSSHMHDDLDGSETSTDIEDYYIESFNEFLMSAAGHPKSKAVKALEKQVQLARHAEEMARESLLQVASLLQNDIPGALQAELKVNNLASFPSDLSFLNSPSF